MYIHSYQSFIWNKVLSKRLQKFGLKVLVGDLIPKNKNGNNLLNVNKYSCMVYYISHIDLLGRILFLIQLFYFIRENKFIIKLN